VPWSVQSNDIPHAELLYDSQRRYWLVSSAFQKRELTCLYLSKIAGAAGCNVHDTGNVNSRRYSQGNRRNGGEHHGHKETKHPSGPGNTSGTLFWEGELDVDFTRHDVTSDLRSEENGT